jgi:tetratricopeptide (TPR) repeat protein
MQQGKVDEAQPFIEALEKMDDLPPDDRLTWRLLKSQLLIITGDFAASHQLAGQVWMAQQDQGPSLRAVDASIAMAEALENLGKHEQSLQAIAQGEQVLATLAEEQPAVLAQRTATLIFSKGRNCFWKGDNDQAMDYFEQSLAMRQEHGNKHAIAISLQNVGIIHFFKGNVAQGLDYHQQALKLFQKVGNKYRLGWCLANIGEIYAAQGELDRGLDYHQQGLALNQEIGNKKQIALSLNYIGSIYYRKGALAQAMESYQQSQALSEEVGDSSIVATWAFGNMGLIYWYNDELDRALERFEQKLANLEKFGQETFIAGSFFDLIRVCLDKGSVDQAQDYLRRLQQLNDERDNKSVNQRYRVAQALVLKTGPRVRKRAKAAELLEQVVSEEINDHETTVAAMFALCELLLDEVRAYGDSEALQEAKALAERLYALAQQQHSFSLVVDALILQGKFALIEGNLTAAEKLLEQAAAIAEEKDLGLFRKKALAERRRLNEQYERWQHIIQSNAPFQERLEQAQLANYIQAAQKVVKFGREK